MNCRRVLGSTDVNYKIICAGSGFDIGAGRELTVQCGGKTYSAKMHSKTKGRIDGLSKMYADFGFVEGEELELEYDEAWNTVTVKRQSGTAGNTQTFVREEKTVKVEKPTVIEKPVETKKQEEKISSERLREIFTGLDPVVRHQEYYYGRSGYHGMTALCKVAANRNWIVFGFDYSETWGKEYYLRNEETGEVIPLDISFKYDILLGMNRAGIWFLEEKYDREGYMIGGKIKVITPYENNSETVYKFKKCITQVYIYDMEVYCVLEAKTKETLVRLAEMESWNEELLVVHKDEHIKKLSVGKDFILYYAKKKDTKLSGWYLRNKPWPAEETFLNKSSDIEIIMVDLARNLMWTEMTEREKSKLGRVGMIARRLGEPKEMDYLVWKKDGKPCLWCFGSNWYDSYHYFDGEVMYNVPHYASMDRILSDGSSFRLGETGHGECQKFVVSDKYLYVNYDAHMPVRLPKRFTECKGSAKDNPEAELIWGEEDIRF